jgi:iron complex transport system permease protein
VTSTVVRPAGSERDDGAWRRRGAPAAGGGPRARRGPRRQGHGQQGHRLRGPVLLVLALVVLLGSVVLAVTVGAAGIGPVEVWRSIGAHLGVGTAPLGELRDSIVWDLRLPRVLTAAAVGAGLAICGAVMQSLTRNPLADPYLLGLSSGASTGAVVVVVLGAAVALPLAAFVGALAALALTLTLAGSAGSVTPSRTVLAGIAVSQLGAAATSFVVFWSADGDSYREILSWLLGSLGGATWQSVGIAVPAVLVVGGLLVLAAGTLDAFAFGDATAASLGVDVRRVRWLLLTGVALLTGALVAVSGAIGFVGLVLPHATRLLVGARHRLLLPLTGLIGATFLVWADTAARTVFSPRELPVGVLTALVGAPVFAWILHRRAVRA